MKYLNTKGQRLREDLLTALLAGKKLAQIAKELDVTEQSLRNWMAEPEFSARYAQARHELFGKALDAVQSRLEAGVEAMWSLVLDPEASPTARVAGFRILMEAAWRQRDLSDLEERISKLEGGSCAA